jgi:FKBP-type peptidyl-prolyl cis-trans isomerase
MKKLAIILSLAVFFTACTNKDESINQSTMTETEKNAKVDIQVILEGKGKEAKNGDKLKMHYTGFLTDQTKFDSSIDKGRPFEFVLGSGSVIKGWDIGVLGMKVGEKRRLTIPYELGYGVHGYPPVIPAKATLIFDIELIAIN